MDVQQVLISSSLSLDLIQRFRFNGLMDFKKPARSPEVCVAYWEPIIAEANRIYEERKAVLAAWPAFKAMYRADDHAARAAADKASLENARGRIAADNAVFAQMMHCGNLRDRYSHELAHSLWYQREAAHRAIGDRVRAEYEATWRAEFAAQDAFENEQADAAIAALKAAQPHLPEKTLGFLRRHLKYRLHLFFRRHPRSAAPRRVMRGVPPVLCGSLPSKARLIYPESYRYTHIDKAF